MFMTAGKKRDDILLEGFDLLRRGYDKLQSNSDRLQESFDKLQANFDKLQANFDKLQANSDRLQESFDKLQLNFDRLQSNFDRLEVNFDKLSGRVDAQFQNLKDDMRDQFKQVTRGLDTLTTRVDSLEKVVLEHGDRILGLENKVGHVTLEIRELRVEIRDRVIVRLDNQESRIYKLERQGGN